MLARRYLPCRNLGNAAGRRSAGDAGRQLQRADSAKLYEYLRADRPIIALTDPVGDTATTLRQAGVPKIARIDSAEEIEAILSEFSKARRRGAHLQPA